MKETKKRLISFSKLIEWVR